ncbi:MAG: hypothetical protein V2I24_17190 [Halieaceae bacterium]|jgi:hypothetical protein|nr:hypothetical protein [Halieaceae bacterium]
MMPIPTLPRTPAAIALTVVASALILVSVYFQLPMWIMELTGATPSAGGGEALLALFVGLPTMLLAGILTAVTLVRSTWRNRIAWVVAMIVIAFVIAWMILILMDSRA